jgi:hypothetical protein
MGTVNKQPVCLRQIFFCLLLLAIVQHAPSALGATYDATGIWNYSTSGVTNNCPDGDTDAEKGTVGIIQNEDTFILIDGHGLSAGRVSGAEYTCSQFFYEDWGIVEQHIHVTLSSSTQGSGAVEWTWSDGYDECSGGCSIYITKSEAAPTYNITGIWSYSATNTWNDCGEPNDTTTGYVTVTQNGNTFRFTDETGGTHPGVASGVTYVCTNSYPEDDGTTTESIIFLLSNANSGSGEINWTWTDGYDSCSGIDSLTLTKTGTPNNAPYSPSLISPAQGSTSGCTPQLTTGNFSDPDSGDTHLQTEWQIGSVNDFSSTAFVKISKTNLTSLKVPQFVLAENTTYYWRVRYYDNHSMASPWSGVSSFKTHTTNWDDNTNGIPDNYENEEVDLNGDGTDDIDQTDIIKSLNTKIDTLRQMGVSGVIDQIEYVDTIDPAEISNISRPYLPFGLMPVSLGSNRPTDTTEVTFYFSEPGVRSDSSWYMFDPNSGWIDYSAHATFYDITGVSAYRVSVNLKDWGFGDTDGVPNAEVIKVAAGAGCASFMDIRVTDSFTKQGILNAQVKVNIWNHVLPAIQDGYYLGMITPGTYTLTVSAPGYRSIQTTQIKLLPCETVTRTFELKKGAGGMEALLLLLLGD